MSQGINAQEELNVISTTENGWLDFTDASNSLYHYLTAQAVELLDKRKERIARISSLAGWQERQQQVKKTLLDIVGPFPEKTPLNTKIVRAIKKDGYRMEHVIFESRPGFFVTSTLFLPVIPGRKKAPAIIYCSGHTLEGYRSKVYLHAILNLVKKGFIVMAFDPVGQGERIEYLDPQTGNPTMGGTTNEHSYAGAQAFIIGSSYSRYMIWDGIRAVDYLLSRKEVDPGRIGITGRSGGGTQSALIAAFDERIHAAAPECYITGFARLLQSIGPQDAEQNLYHEISSGIDHADLLEVRAPKPALVITTTRDFFSIQGARETAAEVESIYQAYGKAGDFGMVEDDAPHESTKLNREAMYAFFQRHLENPGSPLDQEADIPSPEELRVTPTGQIASSLKGETVFTINRQEAMKCLSELNSKRKDFNGSVDKILNSARKLSGYRDPGVPEEPVFTGRIRKTGYAIEKYFIEGESGYVIPFLLAIPDKPNNKGIILLNPSGKTEEFREESETEWFVSEGFTVLVPDLIGTGEIGPGDFKGDSYIKGYSLNMWFSSVLIGRSIVGIQAGDVVSLAHYIVNQRNIKEVYGLANGETAPVLLHAAAFDPVISRIALFEPYSSYRCIVMSRTYNPGYIRSTVPGALLEYDLPDLSASLAPRKLLIVGLKDGSGNRAEPDSIKEDLAVIRDGYHLRDADDRLNIVPEASPEKRRDYYKKWIE